MIVDAVTGDKCHKCGSHKHTTHQLSGEVKCFKCQEQGHIGANCPKRASPDGKGYGVVKGQFDKGKDKKGKPRKGFGKKGKLNEVSMSDEDWWWHQDDWNW